MNSDPGFAPARAIGTRGGVTRVIFALIFLTFVGFFASRLPVFDPSAMPLPALGILGLLIASGLIFLVTEGRRLVRSRGAWTRAARGAVSLTLRGKAVAKRRTISGLPMRTVVVQHEGEDRYVHLLFAPDAPASALRQGPVSLEFFIGGEVAGPARILLPNGRTLWAFTTRLGARAETTAALAGQGRRDDDGDPTWSGTDGWTRRSTWGSDSTWTSRTRDDHLNDRRNRGDHGGGAVGGGLYGGGLHGFDGSDSGRSDSGSSGGGGSDSGGGS